jgi:hypothetical protein
MAAPSLFGTGLFGAGLYSRNTSVIPWTGPVAIPVAGTWAAFDGCSGPSTGLPYGRRAYGRGPYPKLVWAPAVACGTSNWQPTALVA